MESILVADGVAFLDKELVPIWEQVRAGQRLSYDDGVKLLRTNDIAALGKMADYVKTKRSGSKVYFVINRHINPTNICVLSCSFCDYAKKTGEDGAYEMSTEEILELIDDEIREVHIVGGHHPTWPFERYEEIVRAIHERFPDTQIKAFTASEIDYFHKRWKIPEREILERLRVAGMQTMPGGGAEVFSSRVRRELFPGKAGRQRWLDIHRLAHSMGIRSNATMLYGHIETLGERVQHLIYLRELQDETEGFLTFIPLEYQVGDTKLVPRHASAIEDLRMIATSRLMLDNFPHIKAYWIMIMEETAAIGLHFGADDIDGTIGEEKIAHAAKAQSPIGVARERIVRLVRDAERIPVERDALYNEVYVYEH
ncbi:MAG: aminofutalosine synthase MqnE [Candidatus Krumholzibacteria bacterium]|nr:aminofutalosine synthase MqnE [Candidatus Krumholzibacteria bacterium]